MIRWTGYQAEIGTSRAPRAAWCMGRRLGKSEIQAAVAAYRMVGVRVREDGSGFEAEPLGPTDQAFTSASDLQAQANVATCYGHVDMLCKAGLVPPERWPLELNASTFRLRDGTTARAYADNPRTIRGAAADWNGDECAFSKDFAALLAAAGLLANPTLSRPQMGGYQIRLATSAWTADTLAHRVFVGDGGEGDPFRHYRRWNISIEAAVNRHSFPRPGMTDDERADFLETMRRELGESTYATEMMGVWQNASEQLISPETLSKARYEPSEYPLPVDIARHYGGADIARSPTGDLACLAHVAVDRRGIAWASIPTAARGVTFADQGAAIAGLVEGGAMKVGIDAGGMGAPVAEALAKRFPGRIESIVWTSQKKTELFEGLKFALETGRLRIPSDVALLRDLSSFSKVARAGGSYSYSADRGADGHGDRSSALAMAFSVTGTGGRFEVVSAGARATSDVGDHFLNGGQGTYRGPAAKHFPELFGRPRNRNGGMPWG